MPWGICITPHDSAIQSCHDLDSAATASLGGNPSTLAPQAPPGAASSTVSTPRRPHRTNHPPRDPGPGGQHASMQHLESRNGNCTAVITNGDSTPAAGPALSVCQGQPCMAAVYGCDPVGPTGLTPPPGHRSRPQPGNRSPVRFRIQPHHPHLTLSAPIATPPPLSLSVWLYRSNFEFNNIQEVHVPRQVLPISGWVACMVMRPDKVSIGRKYRVKSS